MLKISADKAIELLLRIGVSFSFFYPPISAFYDPYAWVGYIPSFLSVIPLESLTLLKLFGLFEVGIAIWILFGRRIFIPSIAAALFLFLVVVFNLNQMDVLFRDVPILLMALCLMLISKK